MAGFRLAHLAGFDVETDVRMSADGELVLIHNPTVDETTDGRGEVHGMTLNQLKRLDAGSWFDAHFAGQRIPTFEELLYLVSEPGGRPVNIAINMKEYPEGIEERIALLLERYRMVERAFVFDAERASLERFRILKPPLLRCLSASTKAQYEAALGDPLGGGLWLGSSIGVTAEMVGAAHEAGQRVFVTLVNEPSTWDFLACAGVDGIATDLPFELNRFLKAQGSKE